MAEKVLSALSLPRLVLAGISSGCGKTTVATGLMAALSKKGLKVQGFKAGPDYIDPSYHTLASGLPSRNLDTWMLSRDTVLELFTRSAARADVSVIEGVMGLFDGHGSNDDSGSTADLAKLLRAPVVLVLDVSHLSRSAAALVLGCLQLDPDLNICGVIANNVGSQKHLQWVKEAIEQETSVPVIGFLPRTNLLKMPERHLGLVPAAEQRELEQFTDRLGQYMADFIDIPSLLEIAHSAPPLKAAIPAIFPKTPFSRKVKIAVARDEAFSFYYQDNLDLLEACGGKLVNFSPIHDAGLPAGIQGIYLGGGFPEVYASKLSRNESMCRAIKKAGEEDMAIYAECGGLMYLAEGIKDLQGREHPMVGLVPGWSDMTKMRLELAYVKMRGSARNPLAQGNLTLRGHEFHYTHIPPPASKRLAAWNVVDPDVRPEGFLVHNTLASYIHLHFATHPSLTPNFVAWCSRKMPRLTGRYSARANTR